jgi:hypothetical protein
MLLWSSDDDAVTPKPRVSKSDLAREFGIEDSDSDDDIKLKGVRTGFRSVAEAHSPPRPIRPAAKSRQSISGGTKRASTPSTKGSPAVKKERAGSITEFLTPERAPRRQSTGGSRTNLGITTAGELKPITPSSTIRSSMNASLVFDMVTSLSTNDPGVAIATLRSIVVLGKEYPSDLLYTELVEKIQSSESVAYADAAAIYAALVFVFDKAAACSIGVTFPSQWGPLGTALLDVSDEDKPLDEAWRRNLLVIQFFIYCFQQDMHICRNRYQKFEKHTWIERTRLFALLQQDQGSAKARAKARGKVKTVRNNALILQATGWSIQLWKRVYDLVPAERKKRRVDGESEATPHVNPSFYQQEGEEACTAVVRLIEMLFLCTDQEHNTLQRIQAGLMDLSRQTRQKFAYTVQSPSLQAGLSATVIGLSLKSRSTETEWYECNAVGRVLLGMNPGETRTETIDAALLLLYCSLVQYG